MSHTHPIRDWCQLFADELTANAALIVKLRQSGADGGFLSVGEPHRRRLHRRHYLVSVEEAVGTGETVGVRDS